MANTRDFIAHVQEMMLPTARVTTRAMFGGHGVYIDGRIVAIMVDDELYLKTDATTRPAYEARGLEPFRYRKKSGVVAAMGYWRAPDEALESPAAMREWLVAALGVALRSAAAKPRRPATAGRRLR